MLPDVLGGCLFPQKYLLQVSRGFCGILSGFEFSAQLASAAGHTCLCPCTTDRETRRYPQEMPGLVLLAASPARICPVQIATPLDKGSKCALAAAPSALPSRKLSSFLTGWGGAACTCTSSPSSGGSLREGLSSAVLRGCKGDSAVSSHCPGTGTATHLVWEGGGQVKPFCSCTRGSATTNVST